MRWNGMRSLPLALTPTRPRLRSACVNRVRTFKGIPADDASIRATSSAIGATERSPKPHDRVLVPHKQPPQPVSEGGGTVKVSGVVRGFASSDRPVASPAPPALRLTDHRAQR